MVARSRAGRGIVRDPRASPRRWTTRLSTAPAKESLLLSITQTA
jgi:hypothetical protein